jgi:hypothetical protein
MNVKQKQAMQESMKRTHLAEIDFRTPITMESRYKEFL